jgi:hypothetical protein
MIADVDVESVVDDRATTGGDDRRPIVARCGGRGVGSSSRWSDHPD